MRMPKGTNAAWQHHVPDLQTGKYRAAGAVKMHTWHLHQVAGKEQTKSGLLQHHSHLILPQQFNLQGNEAL